MREYTKKTENQSRTRDRNPKVSEQASIDVILQQYKARGIQGFFREKDELVQGKLESAPITKKQPVQRKEKPNNTGVPDNLKTGIENLSDYGMDCVKVFCNSDKPAQLSHEVWHVVQRKQGRVRSTMQMQGMNINDSDEVEKEANVMGAEIAGNNVSHMNRQQSFSIDNRMVQRKVGFEIQTVGGKWNIKRIEKTDDSRQATFTTPGRGTSIKKSDNMDIQTDSADFEYIIDPVDERTETKFEGVKEAKECHESFCEGISHKIKIYNENMDYLTDCSIEDITQKHEIPEANREDWKEAKWAVNDEGQRKAHIQCTAGIEISKIYEFIKKFKDNSKLLGSNIGKVAPEYNLITPGETKNVLDEVVAKTDSLADITNNHKVKSLYTLICLHMSMIHKMLEKRYTGITRSQALPTVKKQKAKNIIHLAKDPMPLLNRTSFKDAIDKLSREEKDQLFDLLDDASNIPHTKIPSPAADWDDDTPSFYEEFTKDYIVYGSDDTQVLFSEWLDALKKSTPRDAIQGHPSISAIRGDTPESLCPFHLSRPTDIGYGADIDGLLIEIRALKRALLPPEWEGLVKGISELIKNVNECDSQS